VTGGSSGSSQATGLALSREGEAESQGHLLPTGGGLSSQLPRDKAWDAGGMFVSKLRPPPPWLSFSSSTDTQAKPGSLAVV
jgi:hypothetical protein